MEFSNMLLNNRYQVLRSLGIGGFGETYIARDTQLPSGRLCVVKKLRPASTDPQTYPLIEERFHREAAILEELGSHSTQIPTLYAYFEENTAFYLIQELIDGETLTTIVQQQGRLAESQVRDFLIHFLPILDYIHSKHIIHRDIKPDNIIIRNQDNKPVLIDFGAVKEAMNTQITASGGSTRSIAIGTPDFMPSEQVIGRPVYSSDLYAAGLTAIYLLTGRLPKEIESDNQTGKLLWQQYSPSVSPTLAAILDKAICPYSDRRYATAEEMLSELQQETRQSQVLMNTVAVMPRNSQTQTVASTPSVQPSNLRNPLLFSFLALSVVVAGLWFTRQLQSSSPSGSSIVSASPSVTSSPQISPSSVPESSPSKPSPVPLQPTPTQIPSEEPVPSPTVQAVINDRDGYTNVRMGPGNQYEIVARVIDGEPFYVTSQTGEWWSVRTRTGEQGYMHSSKINVLSSTVQAVINDRDGYTNVRVGPGNQYEIVTRVIDGEPFYVTSQTGEWWSVKTRTGKQGYMHSSKIKIKN